MQCFLLKGKGCLVIDFMRMPERLLGTYLHELPKCPAYTYILSAAVNIQKIPLLINPLGLFITVVMASVKIIICSDVYNYKPSLCTRGGLG